MMKQIYRSLCIASVFFALLGLGTAAAQARIVKGTIKDGTGQALPGVNVIIKGTALGTSTDGDGNFSIEADTEDVIVFSFIGYATQEIKVGNQTIINLALPEDVATLSEVVVVGYGSQKTRDLSSAQINITDADMKKTVNTTIDQALQGRAPNVYVASSSGKPGGASAVYIRGVSSINGNTQPMYVIDGVQIIPALGTDSDGQSNILGSLNPDDIESMNVLTGPSAQAIYGSKASNGVIVVTTKRGKSGEAKINFTTMYNLQALPKTLPLMNLRQYAEYSNAWADVAGYGRQPEFADPSILGDGTNWQKALFKTAAMKKQNLQFSGGNDKTTYFLSAELLNQDGLAPNSGYVRKSVRMNIDNQVKKYLKVGANIAVANTSEKLSIGDDQIISTAIQQSPATPLYNSDGSWGGPQNVTVNSPSYLWVTNPVALAYTNSNVYKRTTTFGTFYADVTPLKNFVFHAELNGNFGNDTRAIFNPSYQFGANNNTVGAVNATTKSTRNASNNYYWSANQRLSYNKTIQSHDISAQIGHEAQKSFYESLSGSVQGFTSNNIPELSAGDVKSSISGSSRDASSQESYFVRAGYKFKDKYIFQGTYRADGSSNFGPNNKWGYFPSASVAWRISEESFMKDNVSFINDLKLRAEAGKTGNQYYGKNIYSQLSAIPTQQGQGFLAANFANPNLKWESTKSYDIGLDVDAIGGRIHLTVDAYLRQTDNLITNLPLPAYAGTSGSGSVGSPVVNLGSLENKGIGGIITVIPVQRAIVWKSSFNISFDRNKLTKLNTDRAVVDRKPWFTDVISRSTVGRSLWNYYTYQYDGIIQNYNDLQSSATPVNVAKAPNGVWVGDVKFKDRDGNGVIDEKDRTFIGSPWPKFMFGFTNTVSYKGIDLNVFIQGVYGNKIFNQIKLANSGFSNLIRGAYADAINFARPTSLDVNDETTTLSNPGHDVPRIGTSGNGNNRSTDRFLEDGSYLRIKNVSLSYHLPKALLKKYLPVDGIKFTAGVQNLYTFTHYSGYDPEVGISNGPNSGNIPGFDNGRYPSSRMYNFSLSLDF